MVYVRIPKSGKWAPGQIIKILHNDYVVQLEFFQQSSPEHTQRINIMKYPDINEVLIHRQSTDYGKINKELANYLQNLGTKQKIMTVNWEQPTEPIIVNPKWFGFNHCGWTRANILKESTDEINKTSQILVSYRHLNTQQCIWLNAFNPHECQMEEMDKYSKIQSFHSVMTEFIDFENDSIPDDELKLRTTYDIRNIEYGDYHSGYIIQKYRAKNSNDVVSYKIQFDTIHIPAGNLTKDCMKLSAQNLIFYPYGHITKRVAHRMVYANLGDVVIYCDTNTEKKYYAEISAKTNDVLNAQIQIRIYGLMNKKYWVHVDNRAEIDSTTFVGDFVQYNGLKYFVKKYDATEKTLKLISETNDIIHDAQLYAVQEVLVSIVR